MGHSQTIHLIGFTEETSIGGGRFKRYETHAMSKLEIIQKRINMNRHNTPIIGWIAQTSTGCKMIGADCNWQEISDSVVRIKIKTVVCPGCGHLPSERIGCQICNFSGVTTQRHLNGFRAWQLKPISKKVSF